MAFLVPTERSQSDQSHSLQVDGISAYVIAPLAICPKIRALNACSINEANISTVSFTAHVTSVKVIAAVGEQEAARSLKKAARIIATSPMAFQLRYLQTLCAISAEKNSTIFFPVPIDIMQNLGNFTMSSIGSGFPDLCPVPKHTTTSRDTVVDVDSKLVARTIMETSFSQEEADAHSDTV
ncbi:hypothetical protein X801_03456 [Opisthorchis viverrini]|uniref:Band 7 domain-containing protein n=1 Tax=Opisthorchis viverrini TaxID=6198 RepID=A0A1S8X1S3_OPIVI|nr:hypothetical protein X801_03456 [Opisthorchis viverrini]